MRVRSNCVLIPCLAFAAAAALLAGCESKPPPVPAAKTPGSPPPPPGSTAPSSPASAGVESASPAAAATASGLPPELVQQIDVLVQCHKDYIAAAEKVQDAQAAKDRFEELSQLSQRGSTAYEEVMIAWGKLPPDQKAKFEPYMDEKVLEINNQRRGHVERLEGLLRQAN
jgi:hypothetical protein